MKIWFSYFNETEAEVKQLSSFFSQNLNDMYVNVKQLLGELEQKMVELNNRDITLLEHKHDYLKTIELVNRTVQSLYAEQDVKNSLQAKLDRYDENLRLIMPNYKFYFDLDVDI